MKKRNIKLYQINYCGKKLDIVEAWYPKEALKRILAKTNFEVKEIKKKNE